MHLSDVRLGLHSESGRRWGAERVVEVAETLKKTIEQAAEEKIDLVLIAGGLFAHRPVTTELSEADRIFSAYPGIRFVIVSGEWDQIRDNSPVLSFHWSENVHYVLSGSPVTLDFPNLSTRVYARSVTEQYVNAEELIAASENDGDVPVKIALCYEPGLEKAMNFDCSAFSYAAFGGRGSHLEIVKNRACYSGGLEPAGMTDQGVHGYYTGEISEVTGALTDLRFVPAATASYVPLLVRINTDTTGEELCRMLEKEIRKRGVTNIYRIRIAGKKYCDRCFDLSEIREKYRIADLIDETEPQYDFEALFDEHRQDMIGYFISSLRNNQAEMPEIDRKAMFYGIDALLKTQEKEGFLS